MVSTDSPEIARIAEQYGAKVPFMRSEATSNDFATTKDVLNEVIEMYESCGKHFDLMCCLYPTAPFITSTKIREAVRQLSCTNADSLMSVVKFSFPPQRAVLIRNNKVEYQYPEFAMVRSQDLEEIYHDCGQFYFCKVDAFKAFGNVITPNTCPYILPEEEVQDIDTMTDWILAELKYKSLNISKGDLDV